MMKLLALCSILTTLSFLIFAQIKTTDPWKAEQLMEPQMLATIISTFPADKLPLILNVGPAEDIKGAVNIGPAGKEPGLSALKETVKNISKDKEVIIYCGCCPLHKCPNIRPAYLRLVKQGFKNVKVLNLATNLKTDWIEKGYPVDM